MFCAEVEISEAGEIVGACVGVPAGVGVESGNFGITTIVGSAEVPGTALSFPCAGLIVFRVGGVVAADGGGGTVFFSGSFASGVPH